MSILLDYLQVWENWAKNAEKLTNAKSLFYAVFYIFILIIILIKKTIYETDNFAVLCIALFKEGNFTSMQYDAPSVCQHFCFINGKNQIRCTKKHPYWKIRLIIRVSSHITIKLIEMIIFNENLLKSWKTLLEANNIVEFFQASNLLRFSSQTK